MASKTLERWLAVLFLLGAVSVAVAQVLHTGALSDLEVSLFSSLQFVLALLFGWVVTRLVTYEQFQSNQRKFALAAFRRILEIRASLERLQRYISKTAHGVDLDLLESALVGAQGAVQSSVADWADIIGDEISITRDIERLRTLPGTLGVTEPVTSESKEQGPSPESERLHKLLDRLPAALREQLDPIEDLARVRNGIASLIDEFDLHGEIVLKAFWEERDSLGATLSEDIRPDHSVLVVRRDTEQRKGAVVVYVESGEAVGIVTNKLLPLKYDEFSQALATYAGGKTLQAKIKSVGTESAASGRKYFRLAIRSRPAPEAVDFVLGGYRRRSSHGKDT
jgi:hypothetical protein